MLADAGYGLSASFRQGLSERGLAWAVGIPFKQKVYPVDVAMIFPVAGRGRPRKRHIPGTASMSAQAMLDEAPCGNAELAARDEGAPESPLCRRRVRVADGPPQRIGAMGAQHLPGEEVWLIGEHRRSGSASTISRTCPPTTLRQLAAAIKARWICEQAHQQLKEELGLDHFEGRSWNGLHRHALMTMIAYAFLQHRRLAKRPGKKESTARHHSRACRPCATPSSNSFFDHQISDAHTAEDKSAKCSGVNKSAKVVRGWRQSPCANMELPPIHTSAT